MLSLPHSLAREVLPVHPQSITQEPSVQDLESDSEAGGLTLKIEQFSKVPESCCAPRRPVLRAVCFSHDLALFFQPRCRSWWCESCAAINLRWWAYCALYGARELAGEGDHGQLGEGLNFLTLTSHARTSPDGSVKVFGHAWNNLQRRARRAAPGGQYLLVPERHRDGRLHAHALETFNLGRRWWKDNSATVGLGYMAEESPLETATDAARYVTKYLCKSMGGIVWPKGFRRVRASRRWPKPPELPEKENWYFERLGKTEKWYDSVRDYRAAGYAVLIVDHLSAWQIVENV
jgi:hypothetical protein